MIKKIAVLRANALGDYIFVLPALQALRETFPAAEIILLGRAWHQEYLDERLTSNTSKVEIPFEQLDQDKR